MENYSEEIQKALKKENVTIGQRVSVKKAGGLQEGFLMPKSAGDPNTLVIKLDSGYNAGIEFKGAEIKKLKEKVALEKKTTEKKYRPDSAKPNITLLHTGGTFASRVDYKTGATYPAFTKGELFLAVPEAEEIANFSTHVVFQMMSEDMEAEHWMALARKIAQEVEETNPDGIIITHGTDTLPYTAAALSLMLQDLPVPVVIIGAQRSSDRGSSDAAMNLICATNFIAKSDFAGVAVCMHGSMSDDFCYVHDGLHVKKMHTSRRDTFRSIDVLPYAKVYADGTVEFLRQDYRKKDKSRKLHLVDRFDKRVTLLKTYPGMDYRLLEAVYKLGIRGLVLEGTGLGHAPVNALDDYTKHHAELLAAIKKMADKGVVICMTSQCPYGKVNMNVYSSARMMVSAGVLPVAMTTEAAFVKLGWALGHTKDGEEVKKIMTTNYSGEIVERIDPRAFLY